MNNPEITVGPKGRQIAFGYGIPSGAFMQVVKSLMDRGIEFAFYDPTFPSPSDPGAYFSYAPINGVWRMTLGNHGWSGGIYEIDAPVVANQLRSLYLQGALRALELDGVDFGAHYQSESRSKNDAMNVKLRDLHDRGADPQIRQMQQSVRDKL
jgi:hypothetical protein